MAGPNFAFMSIKTAGIGWASLEEVDILYNESWQKSDKS